MLTNMDSNVEDDRLVLRAIASHVTPVTAGEITRIFNAYPRSVPSLETGCDRRLDRSLQRLKRQGLIVFCRKLRGWVPA